jgi:hypothetical protein
MKKYCKFNATFRYHAIELGEALGLKFISSNRQIQNGTLKFYDPIKNCAYALYESGYVRRENGYIYQLNQVKSHKTSYGWRPERVLASPFEQLGILAKSVLLYRSY